MALTVFRRGLLVWVLVATALTVPFIAAANSPLLAWREPIYVLAGFAGITGLALLLMQPLLARGILPGLSLLTSRHAHRWIGAALVASVVIHVGGLWVTSPPDVVDALLFRSPTSFSVWGVIAMWAVFASALLAAGRRRFRLRPMTWRRAHAGLGAVIVAGTVLHALLIQGTMEPWSKLGLCALVVAATALVFAGRKRLTNRPR